MNGDRGKVAGGTERDRDGGLTSESIETLEQLLEANKKFRRDAVKTSPL